MNKNIVKVLALLIQSQLSFGHIDCTKAKHFILFDLHRHSIDMKRTLEIGEGPSHEVFRRGELEHGNQMFSDLSRHFQCEWEI